MSNKNVKDSQDEMTPASMLCEAMIVIEKLIKDVNTLGVGFDTHIYKECSSQLTMWWQAHKEKMDDDVRAEAAAKLSERERNVLGIDAKGQNVRTRVVKRK